MQTQAESLEIIIEVVQQANGRTTFPKKVKCVCGNEMQLNEKYKIVCNECGLLWQKEIHSVKENKQKHIQVRLTAKKEEVLSEEKIIELLGTNNSKRRVLKVSINSKTFRCYCGHKVSITQGRTSLCESCGLEYERFIEPKKLDSGWEISSQPDESKICLYPIEAIPLIITKNTVKKSPS